MRSCVNGLKHFKVALKIRASGMFSDLLYSSWHFARVDLEEQWLEGDSIPRIAAADLSKERFVQDFERPNRPVIITGLVCADPTHLECEPCSLDVTPESQAANSILYLYIYYMGGISYSARSVLRQLRTNGFL